MSPSPVVVYKHAILKRHYRRAVTATPEFHALDAMGQWALLRRQVEEDATPAASGLLDIMNSREARRDEVLNALEQARRSRSRDRRRPVPSEGVE